MKRAPLPEDGSRPEAAGSNGGGPSNGEHARSLLQSHCRRLVELQGPVLEDSDPEPLHQLRVTMRRTRSTLEQFGGCLELPAAVSEKRLAKSGRRLGMARDLDVLRERLEEVFLPQVPEAERQQLRPVLKQLTRERRLAYEHLREVLHSSRHLELVASLQGWLKKPSFTPLGAEGLQLWLPEWLLPLQAELMLHPGWWITNPGAQVDTLHGLRKAIKRARYTLENLEGQLGSTGQAWRLQLKRGQSLLGELNDLEVLRRAIDDQLPQGIEAGTPQLDWLLDQHRRQCWRRWRELCLEVTPAAIRRRRLSGLLLQSRQGRWRIRLRRSLIDWRRHPG